MSSDNQQPFIDSRAFEKANSTYVPFPSQADAMLASLQLFHDVPCRIMDLVFSVVTHPEFDSKQLNLRNSVDVIDVVEESRLKDRMAVVQARSASRDGRVMQAGFPQFILDEVLDIIHAERMNSIKSLFEESLDEEAMYCKTMHINEDNTLKAMTHVHRSWTSLAQKALGRALYIGRPTPRMNILLFPVRKSIFGPWTSAVAVQFFHPVEHDDYWLKYHCAKVIDTEECHKWFETLHRILVGFTNLKCLYIKSYAPLFTRWSNRTFDEMVWRNVHLEEVTLYAERNKSYHLDSLLKNTTALKNLHTLNIRGARISHEVEEDTMREPDFACLNNVTIKRFFNSLESDLRLLSILSSQSNLRLESLRINDSNPRRKTFEDDIGRAFAPSQCAAVFKQLRSLQIDSEQSADQWFNWIVPYCFSLETLSIVDGSRRRQSFEENVARAFTPSECSAIFGHLRSLHIDSIKADLWVNLIGLYCPSLASLSIICGVDNRYNPRNFYYEDERESIEEDVRRMPSSPQSPIVFDRLYTLRLDNKAAADLWLKWIGPSCSSLQSLRLTMDSSLIPGALNFIPVSIQSLNIVLWTAERETWTRETCVEEITNWMKCLLRIAISKKLSKLKSFTLFISKDSLPGMEYWQLQSLRTEMQSVKDEMSAVCEEVGIKCNLVI